MKDKISEAMQDVADVLEKHDLSPLEMLAVLSELTSSMVTAIGIRFKLVKKTQEELGSDLRKSMAAMLDMLNGDGHE